MLKIQYVPPDFYIKQLTKYCTVDHVTEIENLLQQLSDEAFEEGREFAKHYNPDEEN